jgi:hypothetical protein
MDLTVGLLSFSEQQKGRTAPDQLLPLQQDRGLLKRRAFGDHDELLRRMIGF